MKRRFPFILLVLVGALFLSGISWLYRLRVAGGDGFPAYSSFRADPLGARVFYEALAEVPGVTVERWMRPLHRLPTAPVRTLFLAGMNREDWLKVTNQEAQQLDAVARAGSRVVVIFSAETRDSENSSGFDDEAESTAARERRRKEEAERELKLPWHLQRVNWKTFWEVDLKERLILDREQGALRQVAAPASLPEQIPWKSNGYFLPTEGEGWITLYTRGASPVAIQRVHGRGEVVLATDSYFLSNEALLDRRYPTLLSWVVGSHGRVLFVESHLGLTEEVGVAGLARRYGLAGCFFSLLLLAALWVWQRMALFVPPPASVDRLSLTYHQTAGLEALLRRAVPVKQLAATCAAEWKAGARAGEATRLETALASLPADASPVDHYNAAVKTLKKRI